MLEEVNNSQILENEQPTTIEVSLAQFDAMVDQKKALDRLLENEDFKLIVVKGYLEDEFERLSELLKNPSVNSRVVAERAVIVDKIVAKGYLENFLKNLQANTEGLDNPEVRAALVQELEEAEAAKEALEAEEV